jgi:abhydrolase domain-containing protein 8
MVLTEDFAQVVPVRPGRRLFVRKITIGQRRRLLSNVETATAAPSPPSPQWQLVCLHGTCASERQFQLLLESMDAILSQDQQQQTVVSCLLFDNVGCGQSPSLSDWKAYDNAEIGADLQAVMEQHSDPKLPTVYMGHSYAPSILLPSILDRPDLLRLSGCILLSTAVRSPHLPLPDGGHPIMKLPVILLQCLQRQLTASFLQMAVHKNHVALKDAIRADSNRNDMRVAQAYHGHQVWARVEHLNALAHVPTLVLHGAEDGVVPVQCGQHIASQLPQSSLVVLEQASHMVMLEQPEETARQVVAFLEKLAKLLPN